MLPKKSGGKLDKSTNAIKMLQRTQHELKVLHAVCKFANKLVSEIQQAQLVAQAQAQLVAQAC